MADSRLATGLGLVVLAAVALALAWAIAAVLSVDRGADLATTYAGALPRCSGGRHRGWPRAPRRRRARHDPAANAAPWRARAAGRPRVVRRRLGGRGERRSRSSAASAPRSRRSRSCSSSISCSPRRTAACAPRAARLAIVAAYVVAGLSDPGPRAPSRPAPRPVLLAQLQRQLVPRPCRSRSRDALSTGCCSGRRSPSASVSLGFGWRRLIAGDRSGPASTPADHRPGAAGRRVRGDVCDHAPADATRGSGPDRVRRRSSLRDRSRTPRSRVGLAWTVLRDHAHAGARRASRQRSGRGAATGNAARHARGRARRSRHRGRCIRAARGSSSTPRAARPSRRLATAR